MGLVSWRSVAIAAAVHGIGLATVVLRHMWTIEQLPLEDQRPADFVQAPGPTPARAATAPRSPDIEPARTGTRRVATRRASSASSRRRAGGGLLTPGGGRLTPGGDPSPRPHLTTPPRPVSRYDKVQVRAARGTVPGAIRIIMEIDATGRVVAVVLLEGLTAELDRLAMQEARKFRFFPARDATGAAVPSRVSWTFHVDAPSDS